MSVRLVPSLASSSAPPPATAEFDSGVARGVWSAALEEGGPVTIEDIAAAAVEAADSATTGGAESAATSGADSCAVLATAAESGA